MEVEWSEEEILQIISFYEVHPTRNSHRSQTMGIY